MFNEILRRPAVSSATGYPGSSLYLRIKQRLFTRPVALGLRTVGWPKREVEILINARVSGMSAEEIKLIVAKLEDERRHASLSST